MRLTCQMDGGGHERGMRSGTLNVPGIVGLGAAAEICRAETAQEAARLTELRDRLHKGIVAQHSITSSSTDTRPTACPGR